jgi:hypothetical protein
MLLVEFEPTISVGERPQTYALDRAATGTGNKYYYLPYILFIRVICMLQGVFYESNCLHVTGKFIAEVLEARNWTLFCASLMQIE